MQVQTVILAILMPLALVSCRNENFGGQAPGLAVSVQSLSFAAEGGTQSIKVQAESDWGLAISDKEWCSATPSNGAAGEHEIKVSVQPNKSYEPLEGTITFMHGSGRTPVSVSVAAAEKPVVEDPEIIVPEGYSLVWNDEFDQPNLKAKWRFENWAPGFVNNELQRYVAGGEIDGKKTAEVVDGVLRITAQKHNGEVVSARMNSLQSWKYGYMEARIKLPKGRGTWPAFWMMPNDQSKGWPACGEIDIMEEVGANPNHTSSSIHTKAYNHVQGTQKTREIYTAGAESDFHTYACEWTADALKFYTDGVQFFEFKNDQTLNNDTWPFNKPFYITLNLAWGGSWGGYKGVDENALPCTMEVDYVRVFQKL